MRYLSTRPFTIIGPGIVVGCLLAAGGAESRLLVQTLVLVAAVALFLLLYSLRAPPVVRVTVLPACAIQVGIAVPISPIGAPRGCVCASSTTKETSLSRKSS